MIDALTYVSSLSSENRTRLLHQFSSQVDEIAYLINKHLEPIDRYFDSDKTPDSKDCYHIAAGLMHKAATTNMAALELVLSGYSWEPISLLRTSLEGCASAWDVVHNPDRLETWNEGKFKSTHSISNLNREFDTIGKMYGLLSNMYVHTSSLNASPSMYQVGGIPYVQEYGYLPEGKEAIRAGEIYFTMLVTFVCLQLTEVTFWKHCISFETIERPSGSGYVNVKVSERHRNHVNESISYLRGLVSDPGSHL